MEKLKLIGKYLCRFILLFVLIIILMVPLLLPYLVNFHPLLITPYYGLIWWVMSMNFLVKYHLRPLYSCNCRSCGCNNKRNKNDFRIYENKKEC